MKLLKKGVIVGLRETIHDYDDVAEKIVSIVVSDKQFHLKGGQLFCKYDDAGWNPHPLLEPTNHLLDILDNGGVEEVYVIHNEQEMIVWTETDGWISTKKIRQMFMPKGLMQRPTLDYEPMSSLKCLSAVIAFETFGYSTMRDLQHMVDFEVSSLLFKPRVWWVSL